MTAPTPRRAAFVIGVDLDPIPGFGHTPDTWKTWLERTLSYGAEHYRPTVTPAPNSGRVDADCASRDAECAYLWDRLADAIEVLDRRWAAVGCDACRHGAGCRGHSAEEASSINGHRVVDLEGRIQSMIERAEERARHIPSPFADNIVRAVKHAALIADAPVPLQPQPEHCGHQFHATNLAGGRIGSSLGVTHWELCPVPGPVSPQSSEDRA